MICDYLYDTKIDDWITSKIYSLEEKYIVDRYVTDRESYYLGREVSDRYQQVLGAIASGRYIIGKINQLSNYLAGIMANAFNNNKMILAIADIGTGGLEIESSSGAGVIEGAGASIGVLAAVV